MASDCILGFDFGGTKTAVAVANRSGHILDSVTTPTIQDSAAANLTAAIATARTLLSKSTPSPSAPVAVGASTFGIPRNDHIDLAPAVVGWEAVALSDQLATAFVPAAVYVATDVKAAAAAELRSGVLAGSQVGLYLNLGTGLSATITVAGSVVVGAHGASGEIGYSLPRRRYTEARLEAQVSGSALQAAINSLGAAPDGMALIGTDAEPPSIRRVRLGFLRELSYHLVNLVIAVDPACVAVGGGLTRAWPALYPCLRDALDTYVPFPPKLQLAAFPLNGPLVGAVAMAAEGLNHASERPPALDEPPSCPLTVLSDTQ